MFHNTKVEDFLYNENITILLVVPHIHTKPGQHDQTVTAYIIRTDFSEPKMMLHVYKKKHILMPFGGHVELIENHWQAIAHELEEECGYQLNQLQVLQPKHRLKQVSNATMHPMPIAFNTYDDVATKEDGKHFHTDISYGFITNQTPNLKLPEGESEDIRCFTKQELLNIPDNEILKNAREVCLFMFNEILPNWEPLNTNIFKL